MDLHGDERFYLILDSASSNTYADALAMVEWRMREHRNLYKMSKNLERFHKVIQLGLQKFEQTKWAARWRAK